MPGASYFQMADGADAARNALEQFPLIINDMIIISSDFPTHLQCLEEVFQRLDRVGLKLKPTKCKLFQKVVRHSGHIVSADGMSTNLEKIEATKEWPPPRNLKELQGFLSTVGYCGQYLREFAMDV